MPPFLKVFISIVLFYIFGPTLIYTLNVPLGETFSAVFAADDFEGVGTCNRYIEAMKDKAAKVSHQLYSPTLCQYCLKVQRHEKIGIYPIYHHCYTACEDNQALLTVAAYRDFGDPAVGQIYRANFTFVECPKTTTEETTPFYSTEKPETNLKNLSITILLNASTSIPVTVPIRKKVKSTTLANSSLSFNLNHLFESILWISVLQLVFKKYIFL